LNSSHGDDHSTSRRGGSGHWMSTSGMVATSGIIFGLRVWTTLFSGGIRTSVVCQKGGPISAATSVFFLPFLSLTFRNVTRGVARWYPHPPPPWSFEIIELEGKILSGL
jgi:hypothetical protein